MKTPQADPVIAEVRAVREQRAARFNYDVKAIFGDIRARQEASGRKYVPVSYTHLTLPTKRIV